jgi:beta-glucosidase-like glycosyl hydrolase
MAVTEVKGLQSQHVIATTKHFAGNNQGTYWLGVNLDMEMPLGTHFGGPLR